jgi:DNA polymerase I-like protein with 3'-5' exonuclease and polymerase domains
MKRLAFWGVGVLIPALLWLALPALADTEQDRIAQANAEIQKITGQCISQLKRAESVEEMDGLAASCEAKIQKVLQELEELGHSVDFAVYEVCVTNTKVNYTACFDPIHVGGSGSGTGGK